MRTISLLTAAVLLGACGTSATSTIPAIASSSFGSSPPTTVVASPGTILSPSSRAGVSAAPASDAKVAGTGTTALTAETTSASPTPVGAVQASSSSVLALVDIAGSLSALSADGGSAWILRGAVGSADGSSAFRVEDAHLVRFDTRTGTPNDRWPLPSSGDWRVAVVAPDGGHVVLTDGVVDAEHRTPLTRLAVWAHSDPDHAVVVENPGTLVPEAMSPDGHLVFVLDHGEVHYRVRTWDLTAGMLYDTVGRDKGPAEDMHGLAVHAAFSPDGHILATLYRDATDPNHEPFVHIIDLGVGWTYCADLPDGSYPSIAMSADGRTVYVGAADGGWTTIDVTNMGEFSLDPLPMEQHGPAASGSPVPLAPGGTLTGFGVVVAADATGLSWYRGNSSIARLAQPDARLIALIPM